MRYQLRVSHFITIQTNHERTLKDPKVRLPVREKCSACQMTSAWRCWHSRRRPGPGLLEGPGLPGGGRVPGAADSVWSPAGPPAGPGARPAGSTHRASRGAHTVEGGMELSDGIHDHNQLIGD